MKTLIVEKVIVNLKTGAKLERFAVACSEGNRLTDKYSLTYEAYLTPWTDRFTAECNQTEIEENGMLAKEDEASDPEYSRECFAERGAE